MPIKNREGFSYEEVERELVISILRLPITWALSPRAPLYEC